MVKISFAAAALFIAASGLAGAAPGSDADACVLRGDGKKTKAVEPFPSGARVAFFGDSITRNGDAVTRTAAHYLAACPGRGVRVFNVGISGGGVEAGHLYFDGWLAPLRPTHVVLAFGVNDAGATIFKSDAEDRAAELTRTDEAVRAFERRYGELIDRIEALGAKVALRTPTPYDEFSGAEPLADGSSRAKPKSGRNDAHRRIADAVRRIAAKRGLPLVDDFAALSERLAAGEAIFCGDRVHPDLRGQWLLAKNLLAAQGLEIGAFRPLEDVAAEAGLTAWREAAGRLSDVLSAEWILVRDESLGLDAKLAKVRGWLDENAEKEDVNPYVVRIARGYLEAKPREETLRAEEQSAFSAAAAASGGRNADCSDEIAPRDPANVWDLPRLYATPKVREWPKEFKSEATPIMIEGEPFEGRETWCFAYYGVPEWATSANKAPAIVLVHGGLGTAYPEWVRMWVKRGYAAICVDTCGALPVRTADGKWLANPEGGPRGWAASVADAEKPERDQWVYHAVAAVIRSHSFLRSLPNVDSGNVGMTGISWGGFLTCILAAADDRFAYAVPVYGCGFNYERPQWIKGHEDRVMMKWARLWDASCYLPFAKCPMMWVDGTNDFAFSLDRVRRSAALAADVPHVFSTHLRMVHGHGEPGEGPREILAFADFFARGGPDVVRVGECRRDGRRIEVPFNANGRKVVRGELMFTKDGADVLWSKRFWETAGVSGFDPSSGKVVAELPDGAFAWIVNLVTDDGLVFSSPYKEAN